MAQAMNELACPRCGAPVEPGARFCSSCGAPLADVPLREERRVVTVVFGDLSGFTELSERRDAEEVKVVVDRAFTEVASIVVEFGGRVDKIIGDEVMAVFGAPQAHEDDAERAVRAALAIRRRLEELSEESERERGIPLRMHIGVNTGEVVAGFVGGSDSYTVVGDAVNTGRRIEDAAEAGQVLVGEATYEAASAAIEFRPVGQVTAKGKRLPVAVWEALAERGLPGARARRRAPLIGREEEIALLGAMARIVRRDRRPMMATIIGEAGMGKSRVAAEFARSVGKLGARAIGGRSLPYGTTSPAFALEELTRAALQLDPAATADEARAQVRERLELLGLPAETDRVLALLGLGGAVPKREAAPSRAPGPSSESRSVLLDTAMTVLERTAEREGLLVVAFHELHWAEDDVLDVVRRMLGASHAPLLVVCLARPLLLERRPGWGTGTGSAVVTLEPLPRERAAQMLDVLAPGIAAPVREGVLDRAGGNPFYLEELARLLLDRHAEAEVTFAVPVGVQALVTARLDALLPDEKRLLQDAAVVGEQFWPGALARLEPPGVETLAAIDALIAHGFIEPAEDAVLPGEPGYRFRQTLVREVAYGSVPKHARAEQHAVVGAWLEDVTCACGKEREFYDLMAYHYERAAVLARDVGVAAAGAESKAREYLVLAGDQALGMDAATTAAGFFQRALQLSPEEEDLSVRLRMAESLVGIQRHQEAEEHVHRALEEARRTGDRAAEGKALRLLSDTYRMRGDGEAAREPLVRALVIAKEIGDPREEAEGLRSHGLLDMVQGKWSSSTVWFGQALARYRALGDRRGEGWSLQNLGWASMLMGALDDALEYLSEGEAVFDSLGDAEGAGWCIGMRGWVLLLRGDVMQAGEIADRIEHQLSVVSPEYAGHSGFALELQRVLRAYVQVLLGRLGDAGATARSAVEEGEWASAAWAQALGHYPIFAVALLQRRFDAARAAAEAGRSAAEAFGDPFYVGLFRFAYAWLAYEERRLDDAETELAGFDGEGELARIWSGSAGVRYLRAGLALARGRAADARALLEERLGYRNIGLISKLWCAALLAEVQLAHGDAGAAIATARAAVDAGGDEVLGRALVRRALATSLLAGGNAEGAETALREEFALLDHTDWVVERARAYSVLARALDVQRKHDEAAEAFDRAREMIESLPPETDRRALDTLLLG